MGDWHWPDFTPHEMRSKSDGKLMINDDAMDKLQALRDMLGEPMLITSAYRSPAHNKKVGGVKNSMHLQARAFDVDMTGHDWGKMEEFARAAGFTGFGFYENSNFMHMDTGKPRSWYGSGAKSKWFAPYTAEIPAPPATTPHIGWLAALGAAIMKLFGIRQ